MHQKSAALLLTLCVGAALSPLTAQGTSATPRGGSLTYAEAPGIGSLNPYQSIYKSGPTDRALSMIYEPLFRFNFLKTPGWENVLATGIVPDTPTKGGATAVGVNLKPNVVWHDGTPFTADDVIFTYNYIINRSANKQQQTDTRKLLVDVRRGASPLQVVFEFSRLQPDAREVLLELIIPQKRFNMLDPVSPQLDLDINPMGTGPYKFEKKAFGLPALAAFPKYHAAAPNLEIIDGREYTDQALMVENFLTRGGPVQLVVEVPPTMFPRVERSGVADLQPVPSYNVFAIALRQKPGSVLNDERVRRALTMALNREQILEQRFGGKGAVVSGPIVNQSMYYDASVKPLKYDVEAAKKELQALIPPNTRLTFIYPTAEFGSDTHISDMVISMQQSLEALGLKIILQGKRVQFFEQTLFGDQGDFDMALVRWEFNPAYDIRPLFHSKSRGVGGLNYMNFEDLEVDRWLDDYERANDVALRQKYMSMIQARLNSKAPAIFLVSEEKVYAYHTKYSIPPGTVDPFYFFTYAGRWWLNQQ